MKFTVLTTSYNCGPYIKEAIDSYLAQTYNNKELIVVDDCSTDDSWEIIQGYVSTHPDIIAIRNPQRLYCSSSYDVALKAATGEVCGILDGDDVLMPEAMTEVANRYKSYPHLYYIYTQFHWCDDKLRFLKNGVSGIPYGGLNQVDCCLRWKHTFSHWRTFKTSCRNVKELFPPGLRYGVDKVLGFNLEEVGPGGFINIPLYKYRFHKKNMTHYAIGEQKNTTLKFAERRRLDRKKRGITTYKVMAL